MTDMDSKNLMIGNWVDLSNIDNEVIPCQIVELRTDDVYIHQPYDIACDIVDYGMVRPIMLTAEILEKNGFVYEYDYGSYYRSRWGDTASDKYVTIGWNSRGEMYQYEICTALNTAGSIKWSKKSAFGNTEIFVHELQQLLRLCGLTKLANNFKL